SRPRPISRFDPALPGVPQWRGQAGDPPGPGAAPAPARAVGGSAVWGPQRVESPFLVEELAGLLDKPVGSPGLKLAHGDAVLEPDEDLGRLPDPADVRVQYDTRRPFDRSFCREMATLAHSACDQVFFTGDVIAAGELEIPGAQTVRVEVLDDDIPSLQLNVRLRIPEGSPLISSASGDEVELRLTEIKLHSEEAVKEDDLDAHLVKGTIEERGGGSLLVSAELALEYDDSCELYDVEVVDGPLFQLMQRHASKAVREGVSSQTGAVPTELAGTLNRLIDELKSGATPDYHPGSNGVVCDIVSPVATAAGATAQHEPGTDAEPRWSPLALLRHPSLYPFVEGTSVVTGLPGSSAKVGGNPEGRKTDMWGRNYEGSKYQWLPSEVSVSAAGKCTFDTYINNLDSATQRPLYAALESLLGRCLPLLEASWAHGSATCDDNMNDDRFTLADIMAMGDSIPDYVAVAVQKNKVKMAGKYNSMDCMRCFMHMVEYCMGFTPTEYTEELHQWFLKRQCRKWARHAAAELAYFGLVSCDTMTTALGRMRKALNSTSQVSVATMYVLFCETRQAINRYSLHGVLYLIDAYDKSKSVRANVSRVRPGLVSTRCHTIQLLEAIRSCVGVSLAVLRTSGGGVSDGGPCEVAYQLGRCRLCPKVECDGIPELRVLASCLSVLTQKVQTYARQPSQQYRGLVKAAKGLGIKYGKSHTVKKLALLVKRGMLQPSGTGACKRTYRELVSAAHARGASEYQRIKVQGRWITRRVSKATLEALVAEP
ncbi:unnamed protein product, partial [Prorocentrum cordatum]